MVLSQFKNYKMRNNKGLPLFYQLLHCHKQTKLHSSIGFFPQFLSCMMHHQQQFHFLITHCSPNLLLQSTILMVFLRLWLETKGAKPMIWNLFLTRHYTGQIFNLHFVYCLCKYCYSEIRSLLTYMIYMTMYKHDYLYMTIYLYE